MSSRSERGQPQPGCKKIKWVVWLVRTFAYPCSSQIECCMMIFRSLLESRRQEASAQVHVWQRGALAIYKQNML